VVRPLGRAALLEKALAPIACESRRMNIDKAISASPRSRSSKPRPMLRTIVPLSERIAPCGSAAIPWVLRQRRVGA